MSYLVLARKYRPMFFEDVVGQEHVTQTLQNAIRQNRIANAYLFCGPRGVGKTTVARLLSKALNCDEGPSIRPCNVCSSCIEVNESRSLDVLEIDGASNTGVDDVRNLRESLRFAPNPGKYRIIIIDEVHMLSNNAFNALLKTLEEPPSRVLFIFATTEAHKVPATILSRCQRFDFKRIPTKRIIEQLRELCQKEEIDIDDESLRLIAGKGDGSMRDAESVLDQIIAFAGKTVTAENTAHLLGIIGLPLFFRVSDLIISHDTSGAVDLVQQIFAEGYDFNEFLIGLAEHLRNILIVKTTGKAEQLNVSEEYARRYLETAHAFQVEDLLRLIKIAADTESLIRRSENARIHLEVALIKMVRMADSVQLSRLFDEIEEIKKKSREDLTVSPAPARPTVLPTPARAAVAPPAPDQALENTDDTAPLTLAEMEQLWPQILEKIKNSKAALAALLIEGWPTRLEGHHLELSFAGKNGFHMASVERNARDVEAVLAEMTGRPLKLRCIQTDAETLKQARKLPQALDKREEFMQLQQENELVQEIVRQFDAEFIK